MNTNFKIVCAALIMSVITISQVSAGEGATTAKPAKEMSCKQQAKKNHIKDKKERAVFMKDCNTKKATMKK